MPVKFKIAGAVLAALIAPESGTCSPPPEEVRQPWPTALPACTMENEMLKEKAKYLFHMLEENEVEPTEFDMIALTHDLPQD